MVEEEQEREADEVFEADEQGMDAEPEPEEEEEDYDVSMSDHADFNSFFSEYWYKLQKQLGFNPDDPREE